MDLSVEIPCIYPYPGKASGLRKPTKPRNLLVASPVGLPHLVERLKVDFIVAPSMRQDGVPKRDLQAKGVEVELPKFKCRSIEQAHGLWR